MNLHAAFVFSADGARMSAWLTFRQAKDALRSGRPEDAQRLLTPFCVEGYRKANRMLRDVALAYVGRGEKAHRSDNPDAAWKDLLAAESLNTGDGRVATLRQTLTRIGLAECAAALEAGKPLHVIQTIERLRGRHVNRPDLDAMEEIAQDWVMAGEMADRGDFLLAKATAEKFAPRMVMCPPTGLQSFLRSLQARHERYRTAVAELSEATDTKDWAAAAKWAAEVMAVAPNHRDARTIQIRAWEGLKPTTGSYHPNGSDFTPAVAVATLVSPLAGSMVAGVQGSVAFGQTRSYSGPPLAGIVRRDSDTTDGTTLPKRFLLWIDGIGGYLVCLSNRVTVGQATADAPIDVPLLADVSRMHCEFTRDGEGYVIESVRGLQVNGSAVEKVLLKHGDRVTLGMTCQVVFRQPVAVSPSARLELVSGHRLPLAVDGVVLMADNLILGPGPQCHIMLPWLDKNVILYRSKDGLGVKYAGSFSVDNSPCRERATLHLPSVVSTDAFSFAVEPVGPRFA